MNVTCSIIDVYYTVLINFNDTLMYILCNLPIYIIINIINISGTIILFHLKLLSKSNQFVIVKLLSSITIYLRILKKFD